MVQSLTRQSLTPWSPNASDAPFPSRVLRDLALLEVADDGRGVAPGAAEIAAGNGHFGIEGMRARTSRAAGTIEIASQPGAGTTVRVTLPLVPDAS